MQGHERGMAALESLVDIRDESKLYQVAIYLRLSKDDGDISL